MALRILNQGDVQRLLPMPECIEVMENVLATTARGEAINPLRSLVRFPDGSGLLGMMPAYLGDPKCAGIKVVTVMPGNHGTELDSHQGAVLLFEVERGRPLALIDATAITAIRTAAVSAVATKLLARNGAARSGSHRSPGVEPIGGQRPGLRGAPAGASWPSGPGGPHGPPCG